MPTLVARSGLVGAEGEMSRRLNRLLTVSELLRRPSACRPTYLPKSRPSSTRDATAVWNKRGHDAQHQRT